MRTVKQKMALIMTFWSFALFAQQGINYKALIKDNDGNIVANQNITVQFQILQGAGMVNVYQETHNTMTNANGIVIVNIGGGMPDSGGYSAIAWGSDDHYLNVQIDVGSGLTDLGTTQFMAVPYALHAANVTGLEALDEGNGIGWRLIGRNPVTHGNVGLNGVDLSYSPFTSSTRGATGERSTALGYRTTASGAISTAMGGTTFSTGTASTSLGINTTASGDYSTAMGNGTVAIGESSAAMGTSTTAQGDYSTAIGNTTTATGASAFAMGNNTTAIGDYSTAMGQSTTASEPRAVAMGYATTASNFNTMAIGAFSEASGITSVAMGFATMALGGSSIAMGNQTIASGESSTAMGYKTEASGDYSIAMGNATTAYGDTSTAMGSGTLALGGGTTAMGKGTVAQSYYCTTIGRYNLAGGSGYSWEVNDPLFEIGNGTSDVSRSNAFMVLKNGDVYSHGVLRHSSDRRLKTEITKLGYGLESILQLQPVSYYWKKDRAYQAHKSIGLIAQEVQPIMKELVREGHDKDKLLSLNYTGLIPVLINAIKEQQQIIETLKVENKSQYEKIEHQNKSYKTLLKRVEQLEASMNQ